MAGGGRCDGCNAAIAAGAARCEFCGAAAMAAGPTAPGDGGPHAQDVFEWMRSHPDVVAAKSRPPEDALVIRRHAAGWGISLLPFVLIVAFATFFAWNFVDSHGVRVPGDAMFLVVPAAMVAIVAAAIVTQIARRRRFLTAPPRAVAAVVVAKRSQNVKDATTYHLTFEFEGGRRAEYEAPASLFALVGEGEPCIATLRGGTLSGLRVLAPARAPVDRPRGRA